MADEQWELYYFPRAFDAWTKDAWRSPTTRTLVGRWARHVVIHGPRDQAIVLDENEGRAIDWVDDTDVMVDYVAVGPPDRSIFIRQLY